MSFNSNLKKLVGGLTFGALLLVASSTQAALTFDEQIDQMAENLINAKTSEVQINIDSEVGNVNLENPIKFHVDIDAVSDADNSDMEIGFWLADQWGGFAESDLSLVATNDSIYFADVEDEWLHYKSPTASEVPTPEEIQAMSDMGVTVIKELLESGAIEYNFETFDFINRTFTARYGYQINAQKLADYLVQKGEMTTEESDQFVSYFVDNVKVSGQFWVDTTKTLPVMLNLRVESNPNQESFSTFELSVLFKSFDRKVKIEAPLEYTTINSYTNSEVITDFVSGLLGSFANLDSDGDGITNLEEQSNWSTNPLSVDSDGDGYDDDVEIDNGYNPNGEGR